MLSKSQMNSIDAKANAVLENVFGSAIYVPIPVPLEKILDKYEMTVTIGKFEDTKVSGSMDRENKIIYLAEDEALSRKAFTVGHELGHYFLHEHKKQDIYYRSQILNLENEEKGEELDANQFAAVLLMPENYIRHYFQLTKDIGELAVVFGVSSTAVYYRLKNLGLIA